MGEYTDYPTDYAEVSANLPSGQQSPAAYATTTIIGNSKNRVAANDANRFNMFYTAKEIYPPTTNVVGGVPNQNNSNYNCSINSDSYCISNSNNRATNAVENRSMANNNKSNNNTTMPTNKFNHHRNGNSKSGSNKRNRLKLMTPQNFRINFGNNEDGRCSEQLYVKVGEMNQNQPQQQHTPKSQNGSQNWSQQNFNIYENQLHNLGSKSSSSSANDSEKELIYSGDRSVISYTSSKDFPDDA
jgi:hypothetical protein